MQITQERLIEVLKDVTKVVEQDCYEMVEGSVGVEGWSSVLSWQAAFLTPRGKVRIDWQETDQGDYLPQALEPEDSPKKYAPKAGEECYIKFYSTECVDGRWREVVVDYVGKDVAIFRYKDFESKEIVTRWADPFLEFKPREKSMGDYFNEVHLDYAGYNIDYETSSLLGYMYDHNMIKDPSEWYDAGASNGL